MTAETKESAPTSERLIADAVREVGELAGDPYGLVQTYCRDHGRTNELSTLGRGAMKELRATAERHYRALDAITGQLEDDEGLDAYERVLDAMKWLWAVEAITANIVDVIEGAETSRASTQREVLFALELVLDSFREKFGPKEEDPAPS